MDILVIGFIVGVIGYLLLLTDIGRDAVIGFTVLAFLGTLIWGIWFLIDEWDTFGGNDKSNKDNELITEYELNWTRTLADNKMAEIQLINTSQNKVINDFRVYFFYSSDCAGSPAPIKIPWDITRNTINNPVYAGQSKKLILSKDDRANCISSLAYGKEY